MSKQTKGLLFNFLGFAILYFPIKYIIEINSRFSYFQVIIAAFLVATILAPKFQVVKTAEGEKLFVKWLFTKGVKEIK